LMLMMSWCASFADWPGARNAARGECGVK